MATYEIRITKKGLSSKKIAMLRDAIADQFGEDASVSFTQVKTPESRLERFESAKADIEHAVEELQSLRDELQGWYDNLPENLQSGSKADELQEAIDGLESAIEQAEEAVGADVTFPSMF